MHLCAIALYRYRGIARPLQVRGVRQRRHVAALVVPAWAIAVTLSIPFVVQGVMDTSHVLRRITNDEGSVMGWVPSPGSNASSSSASFNANASISRGWETYSEAEGEGEVEYHCGIFNRSFAIYSSLVSFFLPLAVMVFADIRSVQILRKNMQLPLLHKDTAFLSGTMSTASKHSRPRCRASVTALSLYCYKPKKRKNSVVTSVQGINGAKPFEAPLSTGDELASSPVADMTVLSQVTLVSLATSMSSIKDSEGIRPYRSMRMTSPMIVVTEASSTSPVTSPSRKQLNGASQGVHHHRKVGEGCATLLLPLRAGGGDVILGNGDVGTQRGEDMSEGREDLNNSRSRSRSMVYIDMLASCGTTKVNGRERRAEKTLIWVFATFVALWLPFFCTHLAYGLGGHACSIPDELFVVFTWLGYLSSGVNPCIYTLLNRDFRKAFKNIVLCRRDQVRYLGAGNNVIGTNSSTFPRQTSTLTAGL